FAMPISWCRLTVPARRRRVVLSRGARAARPSRRAGLGRPGPQNVPDHPGTGGKRAGFLSPVAPCHPWALSCRASVTPVPPACAAGKPRTATVNRTTPSISRARARRELSQNFLADRAAIARDARAGGGGPGRRSAAVAARAGRVAAYEIDPVLAARLRRRCRELPHVRCVTGDFLRARPPSDPFHLAGNIPYSATSRIVAWALQAPALRSATLITQLEYARRRTGDYGRWSRLTVRTWPVFSWRMGGRIDRGRFRPVPRVDAAVLR